MWFKTPFALLLLFFSINTLAQAPVDIKEKSSSDYIVDSTGKYHFPSALKNKFLNLSFIDSPSELFDEFNSNQEDAIKSVLVDFILKDTTFSISNIPSEDVTDWNSTLKDTALILSLKKISDSFFESKLKKVREAIDAYNNGESIQELAILSKNDIDILLATADSQDLVNGTTNLTLAKIRSAFGELEIPEEATELLDLSISSDIEDLELFHSKILEIGGDLSQKKEDLKKITIELNDTLESIVETGISESEKNKLKGYFTSLYEDSIKLDHDILHLNKESKNFEESIKGIASGQNKSDIILKHTSFHNEAKIENFKSNNYKKLYREGLLDGVTVGANLASLSMLAYDIYSTHSLINNDIEKKIKAIHQLKSLLKTNTYYSMCTADDFDCITFKVLTDLENEFGDNGMDFIHTYMLDKDWYVLKDIVSSLNDMGEIMGITAKWFPKVVPQFMKGGFTVYGKKLSGKVLGKVLGPTLAMADDAYYAWTEQGFPKLGSQAVASHIIYQHLGANLNTLDAEYYQQAMLIHALASDAGRYLKNLYYFTPGFDESSSAFWMWLSITSDVSLDSAVCGPGYIACALASSKKHLDITLGILGQDFFDEDALPDFDSAYTPIYAGHYSKYNYFRHRLTQPETDFDEGLNISNNFKIFYEVLNNGRNVYFIPPSSILENLVKDNQPIVYEDLSDREKTYLHTFRVLTQDSNEKILEDILEDNSSELNILQNIAIEKNEEYGIKTEKFEFSINRESIDGSTNDLSFSDFGLPLGSTLIRLDDIESLKKNGGRLQLILGQGTKQGSSRLFDFDDTSHFIENKNFQNMPSSTEIKKLLRENGAKGKNIKFNLNNDNGFEVEEKGNPWLVIIYEDGRNIIYLYGKDSTDTQYTQLSLVSGKIFGKKINPFQLVYWKGGEKNSSSNFILYDSENEYNSSLTLMSTSGQQVVDGIENWQEIWLTSYLGENWKTAGEAYIVLKEENQDPQTLLLTLSDGTLTDQNTILSSQGESVLFKPHLTASSLRSCIANASDSATYTLWYLDLANGENTERKSLTLSFDNTTQTFSFLMPSPEISFVQLDYAFEGTEASCILPTSFEIEGNTTNLTSKSSIKQTGQTQSYVNGDDGHYQEGIMPSYTRSTKGVVTDHATGLEWQDNKHISKSWASFQNMYNPSKYTDTSGDTATTHCENLALDGDGWRLPTKDELESIVDFGRDDPSISSIFKNVQSAVYWSSSIYEHQYGTSVAVLNFGHAQVHSQGLTDDIEGAGVTHYVMCVRGSSKVEHNFDYVKKTDVITDNNTGLQWQDSYNGNQIKEATWEESISYCENLILAGSGSWRLPNIRELKSINNEYFPSQFFPTSYWSSTTYPSYIDHHWQAHTLASRFTFAYNSPQKGVDTIRCVRNINSVNLLKLSLLNESPIDNSLKYSSFIKEWSFSNELNLSDLDINILENSYENTLSIGDFIKEENTLKINLTPDSTKSINKLVLQLTNANGEIVKVSGSEKFWSLTKTNHAPRLVDGQITRLVLDESSYLDINTYDSDGDNVTLSIEDNAGGAVTLNDSRLSAVFSDGEVSHTIKIGLNDGKEKVVQDFTVIDFSQQPIVSFYRDVGESDKHFSAIAFATLKGVVSGQIDPNDETKRIFRPNDNVSLAEALKIVINAEQKAGLIELTTADEYLDAYPTWAMQYYTFAREKRAIETETFNLAEIYPTREFIAKLVVKTLDLDSKVEAFGELNFEFSDVNLFTDEQMRRYGEIAHHFGLFMLEDEASPKEKISRAELAEVIQLIFMIPKTELILTPTTIEQGEGNITATLNTPYAQNINSDYMLYDSSDDLTITLASNSQPLSNPINSEDLSIGINNIYAFIDNHGVKGIAQANIDVSFGDADSDGIQDREDKWSEDSRYSNDDNNNGIPDILDSTYELGNYNSDDTFIAEGESILISNIIENGGIFIQESSDLTEDGDGDGVNDADQVYVDSITSPVNGESLTIRNNNQAQQSNITTEPTPLTVPEDQHLAFGVTQLDITAALGEDITIEIFIDKSQQISDYILLGNDGEWHEVNASIEEIGEKKKVSFVVKEGGNFDQDQTVNGVLELAKGGVMVKTGFEIMPDNFLFGETKQGDPDPIKTFTVKNTGLRTLNITDAHFIGQHASDYLINSDGCSGVLLDANEECSIEVAFSPTTSGSKAAALNVISDDPDNTSMMAFLRNYEAPEDEASRRLPPVLNSLVIFDDLGVEVETMLPNKDYTVEWSILGYHEAYISSVVMFNCSGIADKTNCGANFSDNERFLSSGAVQASSTHQSSWSHSGQFAETHIFRHTFTTPDYQTSTPIVIRFYRLNTSDLNSGAGGLSLIIPGNHAAEYYDTTGRRVKNVISP